MGSEERADLAAALARAWRSCDAIEAWPSKGRPATRVEAYQIQDAMAEALGETVVGWKVGATSAKMRELDGHDDVIPGRMFASTTWEGTDVDLPSGCFPRARVETEFAFRLTRDAPLRGAPWMVTELADAVELHPAIEIIGNRYPPDGPKPGSLDTIADNGGGIGFVFGPAIEHWQDLDFQHHPISLTVDDGRPSENFLGDLRCIPLQALADLLNHLQSRGFGMAAGDWVSTGAATVPLPIHAGARVRADFGKLGRIDLRFVEVLGS
ncbi:MAG: 2-keto-4-pentenoate hydratase [Geminicoccaceae bacterium]